MTPPVILTEEEALDTLRVIAALHGGHVTEIGRSAKFDTADGPAFIIEKIGLAIYTPAERLPFNDTLRWIWTREDGLLAWRLSGGLAPSPANVFQLGRIDRGLGAIKMKLTEDEALAALCVFAAMHGGQVRELDLWPQFRSGFNVNTALREPWGLCVLMRWEDDGLLSWVWSRETGQLQRASGYRYLDGRGVLLIGALIEWKAPPAGG